MLALSLLLCHKNCSVSLFFEWLRRFEPLTSPVSYLFGNALPLLRLPKFQPALYFFNIGSVRLYEKHFFFTDGSWKNAPVHYPDVDIAQVIQTSDIKIKAEKRDCLA
jgi:hypothetical protein